MKFEAVKITKVLEQNFTHLMRDFYEMQTEYLASLNIIYDDLDASLVAMVLTNQLYKNTIEGSDAKDKISFKNFYQKNNFNLPVAFFRIKEISSIINSGNLVSDEIVGNIKYISESISNSYSVSLSKNKFYEYNYNFQLGQIKNLKFMLMKRALIGPIVLGYLLNRAKGFYYIFSTVENRIPYKKLKNP